MPASTFTPKELQAIRSALHRAWLESLEMIDELHAQGDERHAQEVHREARAIVTALDKLGGPFASRAHPLAAHARTPRGMALGRTSWPDKKEWPWMTLKQARAFEALAKARGVSVKARSPSGFFTQFKHVGGDYRKLNDYWWGRRQDFVARHMKQARVRREAFLKTGELSPRHLALIMWAYSPVPKLALKRLAQEKARR